MTETTGADNGKAMDEATIGIVGSDGVKASENIWIDISGPASGARKQASTDQIRNESIQVTTDQVDPLQEKADMPGNQRG